MKNLAEHIDEFATLLDSKSFDGYFFCNSGPQGTLRESLHQHFTEVQHGQNLTRPFYLTTYCFWKPDNHVRCDFKMIYDRDNGFKVNRMEAGYFAIDQINPVRTIELRPKTNDDIPTRAKVNLIVGARKKRDFKL
jgi:hypothetical protein